MVVKRRHSPTMDRNTISVDASILPLHHNTSSSSQSSGDDDEYEYDDLSTTCDSSARPTPASSLPGRRKALKTTRESPRHLAIDDE